MTKPGHPDEANMGAQDDIAFYKLPSVLDLRAAEALLATIRQTIAAAPKLRLDAADVDAVTLPCAQIVMAAIASGAEVKIQRPSQAFLDAFADLGLDMSAHCASDVIDVETAPEAIAEEISIAPEPEQAGPESQPAETASMCKRILTIDDSKTIRDMLRLTLLDAGFEVHQAVDGEEGAGILDKETFDVVITDINMPKMDGYGVIRHMRSMPVHDSTPILVLTTESEGSKRNIARDAGATGWLVKPFDPEALVATIHKVAP
jgi:two-component system chemotaxis response regulator CheY